MLYIVHFTAFCLGGPFFPVTVYIQTKHLCLLVCSTHGDSSQRETHRHQRHHCHHPRQAVMLTQDTHTTGYALDATAKAGRKYASGSMQQSVEQGRSCEFAAISCLSQKWYKPVPKLLYM